MTPSKDIELMISDWLKSKPSRNIRTLSRLSGVSYSSVWRAANGEGEVSQNVAVNIAQVILEKVEMHKFFEKYYPDLVSAIVEVRQDGDPSSLTEYITSPEHLKIIILAHAQGGTSDDEVRQLYGEQAMASFGSLKDSGELICSDGRWMPKKDVSFGSIPLARKVLASIINSCNPGNDSKPYCSYAYTSWNSLSESAAKQLYRMIRDYNKELVRFVTANENQGNVLVTYGLLQNVIKGQEDLA